MASFDDYMNSPDRAKEIGKARGNLERELNNVRFGPGGQGDRDVLAQERIAQMHYGPGGTQDRANIAQQNIAGMQYGPGGMGNREILAMQPVRAAQTRGLDAATAESQFKLGTAKELRPDTLAAARSTYGLNAATNQGEVQGKLDENYGRANARALALPEHSIPYTKVAPEQPSTGNFETNWLTDLWHGNLFNTAPSSAVFAKERKLRNKTAIMNRDFLASNPEYR